MSSSARRWTALIPSLVALGCATGARLHDQGIGAFQQGAYEEAIESLERAVQADPDNLKFRFDLRVRKEAAVQLLNAAAEGARASGDADGAERTFRRALTIDPRNDRAVRGLASLEGDRRHLERTARAAQLLTAKKLEDAALEVHAVLAEDPGFRPATEVLAKIDLARGPANLVQRLKLRDDRPVTLQFRDAPTKMVFEALARQTGINFVFDKDVKSDGKTTIFVTQVPVEQAIDLILVQNQLARQVLSENVVLLYPDTPAKQKDYREEVVHTFALTNAAPKDAETLLKTVLGTKTTFIDDRSGTLVMRDTPEHVRMAEKLVQSLDVSEPEVVMEVEVLEITHSLAEQLGINYPSSVAFSPLKPTNSLAPGVDALVLSDVPRQNANTIAVSSLAVSVDLLKMAGVTNVLSTPRIRARNKEKAKILVGNRLPVVTSGTSSTVGGAFATSNVQYIDVGLTLEVQPTVRNDGNVAIKVALEVSSIVKQINVPIGNGGTTLAYEIGTRNASTLLELKDGETQVLAGLIQDSDRRSSTQIPLLGDIPVLGRLFGSRGTSRDKNEIVLSITPRVVRAQPRPTFESTEFWYGSESQTRSAPLGGGGLAISATTASGAGPVVPGGVSFASGGGGEKPGAPASSGPRSVPQRIDAAAGPRPSTATPAAPAATPASPAGTPVVPAPAPGPAAPAPVPAGPAPAGSDAKAATPVEAKATAATKTAGGEASDAQAVGDTGPKVTIEGPETAKVGDEVDVSVKLASGSAKALGRIRTQVGFDATALQLVSAEPGDLAPSGQAPKLEVKPGGVQLELVGDEGAPVSGGGSLIDLRFRAVAARPAIAIATQVVLVGEDGVAVAATQATPLRIAVTSK